jgi:hypothetical protein
MAWNGVERLSSRCSGRPSPSQHEAAIARAKPGEWKNYLDGKRGLSSSGTENLHKLAFRPHRRRPCAGRAAGGVHLGRQNPAT